MIRPLSCCIALALFNAAPAFAADVDPHAAHKAAAAAAAAEAAPKSDKDGCPMMQKMAKAEATPAGPAAKGANGEHDHAASADGKPAMKMDKPMGCKHMAPQAKVEH